MTFVSLINDLRARLVAKGGGVLINCVVSVPFVPVIVEFGCRKRWCVGSVCCQCVICSSDC